MQAISARSAIVRFFSLQVECEASNICVEMRVLTCFLLLSELALANGMPHPIVAGTMEEVLQKRDDVNRNYTGEPPTERTIYVVISLFFMMVLSLLLGARFDRLRRSVVMSRNITSMIVLILYFLVFAFIFSSAIMLAGQGLYNHSLCFSATWICLILYTACKGTIYIFLVERVHVVRAPFVRRSRDWLYWACMVMVTASFLGVAINAYLRPIIEMKEDGRCHIGIPGGASIPFMVVDISVDVALTGVFFYLLRPVAKLHGLNTVSGVFGKSMKDPPISQARRESAMQSNIRVLLWKSLIGSMLIMLPTIANMVQFYITSGRELALICLAICVADVSWDAVVIHWLTFGSVEAEKGLTLSAQESRRAQTSGSLQPKESQEAMVPQPRGWRVDSVDGKHEAGDTITSVRTP